MGQLVGTLVGVVAAIAVTLGAFVLLNALVDLAPKRFRAFATVAGAVLGLVVGTLANSGGWFLGGPLWPIGGAAVGALVGNLVVGRRPAPPEGRYRIADRLRPIVFVGPALLFLAVALVAPTIRTVYLSFRRGRGDEAAGIDNYREAFDNDRLFNASGLGDVFTSRLWLLGVLVMVLAVGFTAARQVRARQELDFAGATPRLGGLAGVVLLLLAAMGALSGVIWNNLFWVVFVTLFSTVIGLGIAVLADRSRGENLAKSLIFLPMAISFVGASIIWRFVYAFTPAGDDQIGLLNAVWVGLGGEPQAWVQQTPWNNLALIVIMIWIQTGFAMVVLSSAIKGVPTELLEAARMDGASESQTFWQVTLPQIRPTIAVVVTTLVITVLKVYDIVKVMTNGEFGTSVIANEMFDEAFINRNYGLGSALAVLLFVAVVPVMVVNVRRFRRGERA